MSSHSRHSLKCLDKGTKDLFWEQIVRELKPPAGYVRYSRTPKTESHTKHRRIRFTPVCFKKHNRSFSESLNFYSRPTGLTVTNKLGPSKEHRKQKNLWQSRCWRSLIRKVKICGISEFFNGGNINSYTQNGLPVMETRSHQPLKEKRCIFNVHL